MKNPKNPDNSNIESLDDDTCWGYWTYSNDGNDFDCEYEFAGEILCEECIFGSCGGKLDPRKPREEQREYNMIDGNKSKDEAEKHLKIIQPSIHRIKVLCEESLSHNCSWYEFKDRLDEILKHEEAIHDLLI